jgi:hypothetical protein
MHLRQLAQARCETLKLASTPKQAPVMSQPMRAELKAARSKSVDDRPINPILI